MILADSSLEFWEKLAGGQVGFILATILFGAFYWKVLLPERREMSSALQRVAEAVQKLIIVTENKSDKAIQELRELIERHQK